MSLMKVRVKFPDLRRVAAFGTSLLMLAAVGSSSATAKRNAGGADPSLAKVATPAPQPRSIELKLETPSSEFAGRWQEFTSKVSSRQKRSEELFVRFSALTGAPRVLYGDLGEAPMAAKSGDRAMLFLEEHAGSLGIDVRDLVPARAIESDKIHHFYYDQKYQDLPVFYGEVAVHYGADGHVRALTNTYTPVRPLSTTPAVAAAQAFDVALAAAGIENRSSVIADHHPSTTLGIWPTADGGRLAWKVFVPSRNPVGDFEVIVDAVSGATLEPVLNRMNTVDGIGKVHKPSPVVTEANDALRDNQTPPEASYFDVTLFGLDGSGKLIGPYSQVHPSQANTVVRANNDFSDLRHASNQFGEEEVYWAIHECETTFQSLGFTQANGNPVMNFPIRWYAHDSPAWGNQDNSSFTSNNELGPGTGLLQFGTGGVNDAHDAEIVWHEYGHATLWNQRPGINQNVTSEGIGEGFGDYLAGAMSQIVDSDGHGTRQGYYVTVGEWDATSYNPNGTPHPNLRNLNSSVLHPNRPSAVHSAGQVWSHPCHDFTLQLGVRTGLRAALEGNFLFDLSPTQVEGANAYLQADMMINGGALSGLIRNAFVERQTLAGTVVPIVHTPGVATVTNGVNYFLRYSSTNGNADVLTQFGSGSPTPLVGDWDGNGTYTPGIYDPGASAFFLKNSNTPGPADTIVIFGGTGLGLLPIVGDWDGNGTTTLGVYNPNTGGYFLRNSNTPGPAEITVIFGTGGGIPLAGDWDGNGTDTIGFCLTASATYFLKNANTPGPADFTFGYGAPGSLPVVGNWDASGGDGVGSYVPASGAFFLTNTLGPGNAAYSLVFGAPNGIPLSGDWNGPMHGPGVPAG
jgi:hypothetical protein